MAIYMPPLCRKKKVIERYNPDTFRVISDDAEQTHLKHDFEESNKPSEWRKQWLDNNGLALPDIYNKKTEVLPHVAPDYRINKPHPGSCGFLRNNVRFLNEPICSVYTEVTKPEQQNWWPSRVSNEPLDVPPKTKDTIYRADFADRERSSASFGSLRHTANPNKEPALGTVPVNFLRTRDNKQKFFKEKISYEHQYNSRIDPNYPIRAKRHGSFVWDPMPAEATKKFIEHYSHITAEEGVIRQEQHEAQKLTTETAKLLETTGMANTQPQPVASPKQTSPVQSAKGSPKHSPKQSASKRNSASNSQPKCEPNNGKTNAPEISSSKEVQENTNTEQPLNVEAVKEE